MKKIIIIAGPTACGKTDTSIELAKKINGEIISADSMQVYKYMDIGTAKITKSEMQGIKHYLIDEVLPDEDFSIAKFQKLAKIYIEEIYSKGKTPILVGGTGFYINSIIYNNNFENTNKDDDFRNELALLAKKNGPQYLFEKLKKIDPESAEKIHMNNVKKVIRAIEFYNQTGAPISKHNAQEKLKEKSFDTKFFVFNMNRQKLYEKINLRVDLMIEKGLINEVKQLLNKGYTKNLVSMQGIGYKEIVEYLEGKTTIEEAIFKIKRDTRRFAKRQLTWFRNQVEDAIWIDTQKNNDMQMLIKQMIEHINN